MVEVVYGGDNSIDSENTNSYIRAIHIHGGMEHNLVGYAKYYFDKNTEISRGSEFTRKINYIRRDFSNLLETNYTLNLEQLLKITPELNKYFWQKLKLKKTQNLREQPKKNKLVFYYQR